MIAAMMTAANLGARVTGWGFVVFALGSICWTLVGMGSGQTNLITANGFLTFVNLVGIWRWLGRQRAYEDGGKSAEVKSRKSSVPTLFTATGIAGLPVVDADGTAMGKAVEALIECRSGEISYVVVATAKAGGFGEDLRAVPRDTIRFSCDALTVDMNADAFSALAPLESGEWPDAVSPHATGGAA
jgi:hypothetical protein